VKTKPKAISRAYRLAMETQALASKLEAAIDRELAGQFDGVEDVRQFVDKARDFCCFTIGHLEKAAERLQAKIDEQKAADILKQMTPEQMATELVRHRKHTAADDYSDDICF